MMVVMTQAPVPLIHKIISYGFRNHGDAIRKNHDYPSMYTIESPQVVEVLLLLLLTVLVKEGGFVGEWSDIFL